MKIQSLKARTILNSRGQWTVETELRLKDGRSFFASVPEGTSKGEREAVYLPAEKARENIEKIIAPALISLFQGGRLKDESPKTVDQFLCQLDGTENKSNLGANAILAVSVVCHRAWAGVLGLPLYRYFQRFWREYDSSGESKEVISLPQISVLCLEGGVHGGGGMAIQEFMVVPESSEFLGVREKLEAALGVYNTLKKILRLEFGPAALNVGLEGAFSPPLNDSRSALDFLFKAIKEVGLETKMKIALDCAACTFFNQGKYDFEGKKRTNLEMVQFYSGLMQDYPILFLEDPFSQEDWEGWRKLKTLIANQQGQTLVVGDDLTSTNPHFIRKVEQQGVCNAMIVKPNQIGTVSETFEAVALAKKYGWKTIVSHRSGETCDDFIVDLAVAIRADFVKFGAPNRGERVSKYNRLLKIEQELKNQQV